MKMAVKPVLLLCFMSLPLDGVRDVVISYISGIVYVANNFNIDSKTL